MIKKGGCSLLLLFSLLQGLILHQLQRYSLSEKVLRDAVQVNRWVCLCLNKVMFVRFLLWFNIFLFPHFFLFPSHFLLHPFNFSSSFTSPPSFYAAVLLSSFFLPLRFSLLSSPRISHLLASSLLSLPSHFPPISLYSHLFFLHFFPSHLPCFSSPLYSFLYSSFPP